MVAEQVKLLQELVDALTGKMEDQEMMNARTTKALRTLVEGSHEKFQNEIESLRKDVLRISSEGEGLVDVLKGKFAKAEADAEQKFGMLRGGLEKLFEESQNKFQETQLNFEQIVTEANVKFQQLEKEIQTSPHSGGDNHPHRKKFASFL